MPDKPNYRLDFRPENYEPDVEAEFPDLEPIEPGTVERDVRDSAYLPQLLPKEAEIARLSLRSSNKDAISVRARRVENGFRYRIVDEYGTNFKVPFDSTPLPLTFGELINLIDGASTNEEFEREFGCGLTLQYREHNLHNGEDPAKLVEFVTVTSDFYPEIQRWYEEEAWEWYQQTLSRTNGKGELSNRVQNSTAKPMRGSRSRNGELKAVSTKHGLLRVVFLVLAPLAGIWFVTHYQVAVVDEWNWEIYKEFGAPTQSYVSFHFFRHLRQFYGGGYTPEYWEFLAEI